MRLSKILPILFFCCLLSQICHSQYKDLDTTLPDSVAIRMALEKIFEKRNHNITQTMPIRNPCNLFSTIKHSKRFPLYKGGTYDTTLALEISEDYIYNEMPPNIRDDEAKSKTYLDSASKAISHYNDSIAHIYKKYKDALKKKGLSDSVTVTIAKSFLGTKLKNAQYRVWLNGLLYIDWQFIDFSNANRIAGDYYKLITFNPCANYYAIDIKDGNGNIAENISSAYPQLYISPWGIYFSDQKAAVEAVLRRVKKLDATALLQLPKVPWQQYGNTSPYDTFSIDGKMYLLPEYLDLPSSHNSLLFLMPDSTTTLAYEYKLMKAEKMVDIDDTSIAWKPGGRLIELNNIPPGDYRLRVRYANYHNSPINTFMITIRPAWYQTRWFDWTKGFLAGLFSVLIPAGIVALIRRERKREKKMKQKMALLQLQAYRSQLNPHFIFNALSSIQNLVNKSDNENANRYLTDFSLLLRMTLDQQKAEYWTLQDEVSLLNKYLQLEQLRFSFAYDMQIDEGIDTGNIVFPAMLLQPIVENAIKHGISGLPGWGELKVKIAKEQHNLHITINDNGSGFHEDISNIAEGKHGLRLTKERITFLNDTNKEQKIEMNIQSNEQGTVVSFYLYNYLYA